MARALAGVFLTFLRLGCMSFGGPVAHLGYFREAFVRRLAWLDDDAFAECVAIAQLLPGPASSQTGMLIGWNRAGFGGAFAAWLGFTLPSAVAMTAAALLLPRASGDGGWLAGLLVVAVGVVADAIVSMRARLAPDAPRIAIALAIFVVLAIAPRAWMAWLAPSAIAAGAIAGALGLHATTGATRSTLHLRATRAGGLVALGLFLLALAALPFVARTGVPGALCARFFGIGSVVFGGGHVVLPLMQSQLISDGLTTQKTLLAGYAAAQAMPGPLFSIAAYVGAGVDGVRGALVATAAIFAPSFFLLAAIVPFYSAVAGNARVRAALAGANAGVVGLLAAAFVTPIWTSAIRTPADLAGAGVAYVALAVFRVPPWIVVLAGLTAGAANLLA
ncbi:MAG TPA: chromate efflux transporter [Candidatus Baltobacteraceae bacterium]|jgi:chromate transporter